ncbi:MAG: Ig-like domain-containing protein, partial [Treponemataceae bacterium]
DETAKASVLVSASAVSVRGTASYKFVLDGGEPRTVEAAGAGILKLEGLASGRHTITAVAVDSFGVESPQIKRNFRVVGDAPVISVGSIVRRDAKEDFRPGLGVAIESGTRYEGHVKAPNGLSSVEINVAGRAAVRASVKKETPTDFSFSIPLPVDLPFDRIDLSFKALDRAGFTADATTFFHRVSSVPASGVFEAPGLYLADRRVLGSEAIRVGDDLPFRLRFLGRPIASVVLDPPTGLLSAVAEGQTVVLSSVSDGSVGPTTVKLRDADGDEFTWGPYSFEIHRSDPKLEITSPAPDGWYREKTAFSALVSDSAGESVLSYSPDGTTWLPIAAEKKDNAVDSAGTKATTVDLPLDGPDGGVLLRFRASNASGRTVIVERVVNKDTATPVGSVVAPRSTDAVNGRTTLASRFTDAGKLASVEFSLDGKTWEKAERIDFVSRLVDYSAGTEPPSPLFRATDAAGNVVTLSPAFIPDVKADKPRTLVQLPEEGEVLRSDFAVSGAAFDDDAVAAVHYRFDGGEWKRLALEGNGFSIPVAFASESDNEHTVEVYAEDIYGVTGDLSARKYRVSKEEPKASIAAPRMDMTVRGILEIRGAATDANGIGEVELSFDNAATFNRAIQLPSADPTVVEWSYRLDTRILKDGLHSMYVRPKDAYETDGFFASLVSVDNTPPELSLDLPLDGAVANGKIELSGRATDTRALGSLSAVVYPLGASSTSERRFDLDLAPVVSRTLDLAGLSDGSYGLRLVAVDKAGNKTVVTRDFSLKAGAREEFVALSSPVSGERLAGKLRVQGRLRSPARVSSVTVLVDGADFLSVKPDKNGWFSADLVGSTDTLPIAAGRRSIEVRFLNDEGKVVTSGPVEVDFASEGPWVLGDSWAPGSYIPYRPYLSGTAGWTTAPATQGADAAAARAAAAEKRGREVVSVEVSVDNGRTFTPASGRDKWRFRLETQGFPEGTLPVLARAHFRNGEIANSKLYLNLDKTTPKVTIVSPGEGGRFNGKIDVSGVASDDVELVSVSLAFRDGNKAGYELPSFIQGMYVDAHILGEPSYEIGAGFTFFGDNVKLQFAYGYTPDIFLGQDRGRFHGNVFSAKLLANLFSFPFAFWLGPDWEFLSANFAIGANFSYFTQTQSTTLGTSSGTVIGAVIGQIEFPKMKFKNLSMFRSYSFYVEGQAWFVSAELDGGVKPAIAMGLRVGIF